MKNLIKCFQISCVFFLSLCTVASASELAAPAEIVKKRKDSTEIETGSTDGSDLHTGQDRIRNEYTIRLLLTNVTKPISSNHENQKKEKKIINDSVEKYLTEYLISKKEDAESLRKIIDLPSEELKISGLLTLFANKTDIDGVKKLAEHIRELSAKKNDLMTIGFYRKNGWNHSEFSIKLQSLCFVKNAVINTAKDAAQIPDLILGNTDDLISILIDGKDHKTDLTKEELKKILAKAKPVTICITNADLSGSELFRIDSSSSSRSCSPQST